MGNTVASQQKIIIQILSRFFHLKEAVTLFRKFFSSSNREILFFAIEKAGESGCRDFIPDIKPFLDSGDNDLILKSVVSLEKMGCDVYEHFEKCVLNGDISQKCAVIKAIPEIKDKKIQSLLYKLNINEDERLKREIMNSMTRLKDTDACKMALREISTKNEKMLAASLHVLKEFRFISDLIKLLFSKNETVRIMAIGALKEIEISDKKLSLEYQNALIRNLEEKNEMLQLAAIGAINFFSEKALQILCEKWKTIHPFYRKNVEEALMRIVQDAVHIKQLYRIVEKYAFDFVLNLLKKAGNDDFFLILRRALHNESSFEKYRDHLAAELAKLKKSGILGNRIDILEVLCNSYDENRIAGFREKIAAINMVSDIRVEYSEIDRKFTGFLLSLLSEQKKVENAFVLRILLYDEDETVVESAITAVGESHSLENTVIFEQFFSDTRIRCLLSVIRATAKLKCENYVKHLSFCYNSSDEVVRKESLDALNKITGQRNVLLFYKALDDKSYLVKKTAVKILSEHFSQKTEDILKHHLADDDFSFRMEIIKAFAAHKRPGYRDILEGMLESSSKDAVIKAAETVIEISETSLAVQVFRVCEILPVYLQKKAASWMQSLEKKQAEKLIEEFGGFVENSGIFMSESSMILPSQEIIQYFESKNFTDILEIGSGGMGKVLRAYDRSHRCFVAIKVIGERYRDNQNAVRRFLKRDGFMAMELDHPNIVKVHEVCSDDIPYIVMEYIDGKTIKRLISDKKLSETVSVKIAIQVCKALAYAHCNNIVHRDIKPDNIMLDRKRMVKIMDFGLAKITGQTVMTRTGEVLGTIFYMPPEQVRGDEIDGRADIYALGASLYEMITGKVPYDGESPEQVIYKIFYEEIPSPRVVCNVSEKLSDIIMKCLQKKREDRYKTAEELLADLGAL